MPDPIARLRRWSRQVRDGDPRPAFIIGHPLVPSGVYRQWDTHNRLILWVPRSTIEGAFKDKRSIAMLIQSGATIIASPTEFDADLMERRKRYLLKQRWEWDEGHDDVRRGVQRGKGDRRRRRGGL